MTDFNSPTEISRYGRPSSTNPKPMNCRLEATSAAARPIGEEACFYTREARITLETEDFLTRRIMIVCIMVAFVVVNNWELNIKLIYLFILQTENAWPYQSNDGEHPYHNPLRLPNQKQPRQLIHPGFCIFQCCAIAHLCVPCRSA